MISISSRHPARGWTRRAGSPRVNSALEENFCERLVETLKYPSRSEAYDAAAALPRSVAGTRQDFFGGGRGRTAVLGSCSRLQDRDAAELTVKRSRRESSNVRRARSSSSGFAPKQRTTTGFPEFCFILFSFSFLPVFLPALFGFCPARDDRLVEEESVDSCVVTSSRELWHLRGRGADRVHFLQGAAELPGAPWPRLLARRERHKQL